METKACYKCHRELPLSEFYTHLRMADGHLNKCRECTKRDSQNHYDAKRVDEEWKEKERARGRDKFHRLYKGKVKDNWKREKFTCTLANVKRNLHQEIPEGYELHHWDYNQPYFVLILPRDVHHKLHAMIELNKEEGIYYFQGHALDTFQKHLVVADEACRRRGVNPDTIEFIYKAQG